MRDMIHETTMVLAAAMIAHEANRAYCVLLGDDSQVPWDEAPDWQKESALAGVAAIYKDPNLSPKASHEGWLAQKEADGWVYGETKDEEAKTHHCMVPYDELPEDQRLKDTLFGAVVRAVLFGVSGASVGDGMDGKVLPDGLTAVLGEMPAEQLAEYGLTRMMGPDVDDPMAPDPAYRDADIGQPGDIGRPMASIDASRPILRQCIGATFDGEGITIIFVDGGVARWKQTYGWKDMEPVPGTAAAARAAEKAEEAAAAEKAEE